MKRFKEHNFILLDIILIGFIGIFIWQTLILSKSLQSTHTLKIVNRNNVEIALDLKSENQIILAEIRRIENINDKRFEILGWGLAMLFSMVGVIMTVQFINSKSSIRDLVNEELSKTDLNELVEERKNLLKSEFDKIEYSFPS